MNKILRLIVTLTAVTILYSKTYSQGYFTAQAGAAFPVFKFGNADANKAGSGGAGTGICIGAKYTYPVKNLNLFAEADIIFNGLKKNYKNDLNLLLTNVYGTGADIKDFSYLNLPLFAGANYSFMSKKDFNFLGELGIGVDFFKKTNLKVKSGEIKYKERFDLSAKLAFKAGLNAIYKDKYQLGINYLMLGKQQIKGEQIMMGTSLDFEGESQVVGVLSLTFGYRF
jgi:hypothetical protein